MENYAVVQDVVYGHGFAGYHQTLEEAQHAINDSGYKFTKSGGIYVNIILRDAAEDNWEEKRVKPLQAELAECKRLLVMNHESYGRLSGVTSNLQQERDAALAEVAELKDSCVALEDDYRSTAKQRDHARDELKTALASRDALVEAGNSYIESHKPSQNGALGIQVDPECYCKYCVPMRTAIADAKG